MIRRIESITRGSGSQVSTETTVVTELVQDDTVDAEFLQVRDVDYVVDGLGDSEALSALTFDGEDVPALRPSRLPTLMATSAAPSPSLAGSRPGPSWLHSPAQLERLALLNTPGAALSASVAGIRSPQHTTLFDPLAQSSLTEGRQITGVDLKFATIGALTTTSWCRFGKATTGSTEFSRMG